RARNIPLPDVVGFKDERVKLLAGISREMQRLVGNNSFFLPTRKLGQVLGAHWSTVARWLVAFEPLGILRLAPGEVRKQGGNRSPRYYYGQRLRETEAVAIPMSLTSTQPVLLPNGDHSNEVAGANHDDSDKLSLCSR